MSKVKKICKKDEGVAIMLEDGGGIGFENKLWDNVTKRSMKKGGNVESEWAVKFIDKKTDKVIRIEYVNAKSYDDAKQMACSNTRFLAKNYNFIIYEKKAKGGKAELELPSDTKKLVDEGKVTYRGMGFGTETVKLKVSGKEYIVSREKFQELGGISKIKFDAPFRKFGKGTTIEGSEVSLHLPVEMSVYVPSTKDANIPVSKSELLKRVNEVKEYLANLFGGYSSSEVVGGYASNEGSLIQEDVVKVISFATKKAYEENKQKLINKIANWSTLWSQEAIGFELEGDLYYINQDKKMSKGGSLKGCGCHKKMAKGGNTDCGCWHYEIGGL